MASRRLSRPELGRRIKACLADYETAKAALADIGFTCEGSLVTRWRSCGNPNCRCVDPDQRHGPYYQLSWKQDGRTVSRLLSADEAELYQTWIDNRRRLDDALNNMRDISHRAGAYILQQHNTAPPSTAPTGPAVDAETPGYQPQQPITPASSYPHPLRRAQNRTPTRANSQGQK